MYTYTNMKQAQNAKNNFCQLRKTYSFAVSRTMMQAISENKEKEKEKEKEKKKKHEKRHHNCGITITRMDNNQVESARKYYLLIVENHKLSYLQMKKYIFQDLVQPLIDNHKNANKQNINTNINNNANENKNNGHDDDGIFDELSYQIGKNNETVESINWYEKSNVICVGNFSKCDIYCSDNTVSRIHLFIFKINDKIMVLDSWSANGTKLKHSNSVNNHDQENNSKAKYGNNSNNSNNNNNNNNNSNNNNNDNYESKTHENFVGYINNNIDIKPSGSDKKHRDRDRQILVFGVEETVDLRLGKTHLILNPKQCIICMDKARTIRTKECGHCVMCTSCFKDYCNDKKKENGIIECPLCRTKITVDNVEKKSANCGESVSVSQTFQSFFHD